MAAAGFSLNNLSLFGLVLAIGIVVDDAIVVVENVERNMREGLSPRAAAHETMDEVGGALVAIALVLSAVFIPAAFITGITGQFFRQFAVTIASATIISCIVSLTLSPALCALLFKPHDEHAGASRFFIARWIAAFFRAFNTGFERLSNGYGRWTGLFVRRSLIFLGLYAVLIALTGWQFVRAPTGFIPAQDQGYLITVIQLPPGASLDRTDAVVRKVTKTLLETEGVDTRRALHRPRRCDLHFGAERRCHLRDPGAASPTAFPRGCRPTRFWPICARSSAPSKTPSIIVIPPPPVRGIGNAGGFKMMVQDTQRPRVPELEAATTDLVTAANQTPGLTGVFTLFNTRTPKLYADIDRVKTEILGVPG